MVFRAFIFSLLIVFNCHFLWSRYKHLDWVLKRKGHLSHKYLTQLQYFAKVMATEQFQEIMKKQS